jgi:hypothetical protein
MRKFVSCLTGGLLVAGTVLLPVGVAAADDHSSQSAGNGVLAGNAVNLHIDAPVGICGLVVALFGAGTGGCLDLGGHDATTQATASGNGVLSGNAVSINIDIPVNIGSPTAPSSACAPAPGPCQPAPTACECVPPPPPCECAPPPPPPPCECVPTTTSTSTSTSIAPPPPAGPPAVTTAAPSRQLPSTGADTDRELALGLGLIALGAVCLSVSRRRGRVTESLVTQSGRRWRR